MMTEKQNYRVLPAANGYYWVKSATDILRGNFGRWLVLLLTFIVMYLVSWTHSISFFIFNVFSPVLWGGVFLAGIATINNLEWSVAILFEPLKIHSANLLKLGVIVTSLNYMIGLMLISELNSLIDFVELNKVMEAVVKTGNKELFNDFFSDPLVVQEILLSILIAMLVSLPIMMAAWFAPVLIMEKKIQPLAALKLSFQACTSNFKAFLVYGIVTLVMGILVLMSMYLALLFMGPLFFASYYCSYEDIFPSKVVENETQDDESDTTMIV